MDRRLFLKSSLLATAGLSQTGCALLRRRSPDIPLRLEEVPDFSDDNVLKHVAGIRPYRQGKLRLERVDDGERVFVYNYGHGGAGFTLAWGCAEVASEWIASRAPQNAPVAVIGAGVIGLTSARALQELGYKVRIYAADFSAKVTSYFAGAQWGPAYVARGETSDEKSFFEELLIRSYRRYERLDGFSYGVSHRLNYAAEGGDWPLEHLPDGLIPPIVELERLPFPGNPHRGKLFRTLFMEPPVFLPALTEELRAGGAVFETRRFSSESELHALPELYVVSCMGLGSKQVFNDAAVVPIRGQLVHLKPRRLPYLLIHDGYIFPRADAIVLGGTFEKGVDDPTPDPATARRILDVHKAYFWGTPQA